MKPLTATSNANAATTAYRPHINFDSYLTPATDTNHHYKLPVVHEITKDHSAQLTSALAHEIRNPLANINLSVGILESTIQDTELKLYLDIIARSSNRINTLITDLLKYQQADENKPEKHSIHLLLEEVLEMAWDRIRLKNISVRKDYAPDDCKIILNRPEMKIALTNIIINAIDAMNTEKRELRLVTKSVGSKFILRVEDNGCGIKKKNLKNIFKPYFTTKPDGLGVGLGATYDILRSNHVGVNVESELGKGTCFILLFDKNHH
ncbi:MAG: ATP-binding protein [Thermoproteota archaeon]|nr:ATP-binding protein [Thermoproteota archaeon]